MLQRVTWRLPAWENWIETRLYQSPRIPEHLWHKTFKQLHAPEIALGVERVTMVCNIDFFFTVRLHACYMSSNKIISIMVLRLNRCPYDMHSNLRK